MSIIRTGSTKQYAEGWEKVFGGSKKTAKKKVAKPAKKKATKKKKAAKS